MVDPAPAPLAARGYATISRPIHKALAILVSAALLASLTVAIVATPASAKPKCFGKPATIVGTARGEVILGTRKNDVIVARGGHDTIFGRGGNDVVCGNKGNDRLVGGPGHDLMLGGTGRDKLFGQTGRDRLLAGPGNDAFNGGTGVDLCSQGTGSGPRTACERPPLVVAPPPPPPKVLAIGGPASGQVYGGFLRFVLFSNPAGPWGASWGCRTGRMDVGGGDYDEYRFAVEFPLAGLPAGASLTRGTLAIHNATAPAAQQTVRGYAGDGTITEADIKAAGTPVTFATSTSASRTSVDVTSLLTPSVVASGWAGLLLRKELLSPPDEHWSCASSDPDFPVLTIEYTVP